MTKEHVVFLLLVSLAFCQVSRGEEPRIEDGLLALREKHFYEQLKASDKSLFVLFYTPTCGHSKKFMSALSKAASQIQKENLPVRLAKIDGLLAEGVSFKYNVTAYPTGYLFKGNEAYRYTGGRDSAEIVEWLRKYTSPLSHEVASEAQLVQELKDNNLVAVFVGDLASEDFKSFQKAAGSLVDSVRLVHGSSNDIYSFTEVTPGANAVVFFKPHDNRKDIMVSSQERALTPEAIKSFIQSKEFSVVMEFSERVAEKIIFNSLETLFLVVHKNHPQTNAAIRELKTASEDLQGKIEMSYINMDEPFGAKMAEIIGVTTDDLPAVRIIRFEGEDVRRFEPNTKEVSASSILTFYTEFVEGRTKRNLKSQEPFNQGGSGVQRVVGKNFKELIVDQTNMETVVLFYVPGKSGENKELEKVYHEVADLYEGIDNLRFYKIDASQNDVEGLPIHGVPLVLMFPTNKKDDYLAYGGAHDKKKFFDWVKKNAGQKLTRYNVKADL